MSDTIPWGGSGDGMDVLGSGKSDTPCRRMQRAMLAMCVSHCAVGCVCEPGAMPALGRYFWHFACAARTAGDDGSTPEPGENSKPPPDDGSGKFGTPCERMHTEYASSCCLIEADPELVVDVAAATVVVPTFATDGVLAPQPVAKSAATAPITSNRITRHREAGVSKTNLTSNYIRARNASTSATNGFVTA